MKIVASGDWHLDKKIEGYDLHDHIVRAAESVIDEAHGADFFVHLGDLFDNRRPTPRAYATAIELLSQLGCPIVVIQGNHDVGTGGPIQAALSGRVDVVTGPVVLAINDRSFQFVPWIIGHPEPQRVVDLVFEDARISWDDEFEKGKTNRVCAVFSHLGVRGAILSSGVAMNQGTLEMPYEVAQGLPCPVVNGHIHRRQKLGNNIWMPGGVVSFDMGERNDGAKGAVVLEV